MADGREQWRDEFAAALSAQLGLTTNLVATPSGLTFRGYRVEFITSRDDAARVIGIHVTEEAARGALDDELFDVNVDADADAVAAEVANWLRERT
jgi:hypothetical protein